MSKWVQHKSGQGEKWECDHLGHGPNVWRVKAQPTGVQDYLFLYLPKSEYVEVPAPERWEDVTKDCEYIVQGICGLQHGRDHWASDQEGYRLRKVNLLHLEDGADPFALHSYKPVWAFIVEKREP